MKRYQTIVPNWLFLMVSIAALSNSSIPSEQNQQADSLKQVLLTLKGDTLRASVLNELAMMSEPEEAERYLRESLELSRKVGFRKGQAQALYLLGAFNAHINYKTAISYYNDALQLLSPNEPATRELHLKIYNGLGVVYWLNGSYASALDIFFKGIQLADLTGNHKAKGHMLHNIGLIYEEQNKPEDAIQSFQRALDVSLRLHDEKLAGTSHYSIGLGYLKMKSYKSALDHLNKSLAIETKRGDSLRMTNVQTSLADVYQILGDSRAATFYLDKAERLKIRVHDTRGLIKLNDIRARIYMNAGALDHAEEVLNGSVTLLAKLDGHKNKVLVFDRLYELYLLKKDYKSALDWFRRRTASDDSLLNEATNKQLAELQTLYELSEKEKEIVELEKSQEAARFLRNVMILSIVTLVVSLIFVVWFLYYRSAKRRQLYDMDRKLHIEKLEIAALQERELKKELEFKNRELASYTINFVQKSELMEELRRSLQSIKTNEVDIARKIAGISKLVESSYQVDREWEGFKMQFENVHQDFFKSLKDRCPDLTNGDLKLCALLKLNMNTKEASNILGISPDSVKTARYRLRKKFGLTQDDNLVDFILNLDKGMKPDENLAMSA